MSLLPLFRNDITAKYILGSVTEDGHKLYTLQLRYPRIVHADFMTHRVFSRNASSSRAIPVQSILVRDADMFIPNFRKNQPGMIPGDYLTPEEQEEATLIWQDCAKYCIEGAKKLSDKHGLNVHKQWANRMLEWFGYIDVLVSATEWANFDALRDHGAAQDEIRLLARVIKVARRFHCNILNEHDWHLPYITDADRFLARTAALDLHKEINEVLELHEDLQEVSITDALLLIASAARCCRLSYSKLDGEPTTFEDDLRRFKQLVPTDDPVHASPLEHQATPFFPGMDPARQANFRGFGQFRQFVKGHSVPG